MCLANESGKCHKLRGVLLFSGAWVDNQAQQLGVCIASPSYFLSSLFPLDDGSCGQPSHPAQLPCADRQTGGRHSKGGSRIEHDKEKENDQRHDNVTCARAPCVSVSASGCPVASVSLCVSVRESGMTTVTWIAASMKWTGTNEGECETGGGVACPTTAWWTVETADRPPRWEWQWQWQWQRQCVAVGGWNWRLGLDWDPPRGGRGRGEEEVRRR